MEMALDSVDTEALQIEEDAEDLRAQQVVDEFKAEMGMVDESESVEEETLDLPEDEEVKEQSKTIGKQRSKSE
jgi:phage shock protein A